MVRVWGQICLSLGQLEATGYSQDVGGLGLKNIFLFAKALVAKLVWRLIKTKSLWTDVVSHKYTLPDFMEGWVRNPNKKVASYSIIWKAVVNSFNVVGEGLAW